MQNLLKILNQFKDYFAFLFLFILSLVFLYNSDTNSIGGFRTVIVGLDNLSYLILHGIALVILYRYSSKLKQLRMPFWWYTAIFFSLFCGMVFIYRYANFGIFMRTKIMYAPFMVVALLWLSLELKNITVLNKSKN